MISLCVQLLSFALLIQGIEYLILGFKYSSLKGIFLKVIIMIQIFLSIYLVLLPNENLVLLFLVPLFSVFIYFGGRFNGGSDAMITQVVLAFTLSYLFIEDPSKKNQFIINYVSVILVFSYFVAGWVKFKNIYWRNGSYLQLIVQSNKYQIPNYFKKLLEVSFVSRWLGYAILSVELSFPIVLIYPKLIFFYLPMMILFHLGVFFIFGLNRFFWAWLVCYPCILVFLKV